MSAASRSGGMEHLAGSLRSASRAQGRAMAVRPYKSQAAFAELEESHQREDLYEERRPVPGPGPSTLAYIPHSSFANLLPRGSERPQQPLYSRTAEEEAEEDVKSSLSRQGTFRQRYQALKDSTQSLESALDRRRKIQVSDRISERVAEFTDKSLREFYGALLEVGREEGVESLRIEAPVASQAERLGYKRRRQLLAAVEERLELGSTTDVDAAQASAGAGNEGLAGRLATLSSSHDYSQSLTTHQDIHSSDDVTNVGSAGVTSLAPTHPFLSRNRILARLAAIETDTNDGVPLGLLSKTEWQAIIEDFIANDNARGGEIAIALMQRHGTRPSNSLSLAYLELDAKRGRPQEIARVMKRLQDAGQPVPLTHHELFIRAHLAASPRHSQKAINHLRSLEISGAPLPQSSYLIVLDHLLSPSLSHSTNSHTHAMAWDLFTHLRLVAHPNPSAQMYGTMIRACANPTNPQPERARDLWVEMTQDQSHVSPGREEYEAIIKAMGSTKAGYLEAVNYLREMLAKHREVATRPFARGFDQADRAAAMASRYIPTRSTFLALLEGTKRAGDVHRARWVLAEVLRLAKARGTSGIDEAPEEELLAAVFMTYAAWRPAITRGAVKLQQATDTPVEPSDEKALAAEEELIKSELHPEAAGTAAAKEEQHEVSRADSLDITLPSTASPQAGPQTRGDAIREVNLLFGRIIEDQQVQGGSENLVDHPFQSVKITPRLVNSFLSVHLAHSLLNDARRSWDSAWQVAAQASNARPNGWSFLLALERCAMAKPQMRTEAINWAQQLWEQYGSFVKGTTKSIAESTAVDPARAKWLAGVGPRQTEKVWAAMIRTSALCGDLDGALSLLEEFRVTYPAADILRDYQPSPPSSFTVRMTTPSTVAEPDIPPLLLFKDVDIVHQRLVREGDLRNVGKVKWICMAYEKALEKRRSWRLHGAGERRVKNQSAGSVASRQIIS